MTAPLGGRDRGLRYGQLPVAVQRCCTRRQGLRRPDGSKVTESFPFNGRHVPAGLPVSSQYRMGRRLRADGPPMYVNVILAWLLSKEPLTSPGTA